MDVAIIKNNIPGIPVMLSKSIDPCKKSFCTPMHLHDGVEILIGHTGLADVAVGNDTLELRRGDIIVINRRVPHGTLCKEDNTSKITIQFRVEKLHEGEFSEIDKYLPLILTDNARKYVFLKHGEELTNRVYDIILDMYNENIREEVGFDMIIRGYINILLGIFYRNRILENVWDIYNNDAIRRIRPALEYIDLNYQSEITLQALADTVHINREYFCRAFKKATNITPTEYINHVRIWKSEGLLTTTDKSILEVATEVGFSSVSYYNRVFRKFKTTTPSAYREILYAKNII